MRRHSIQREIIDIRYANAAAHHWPARACGAARIDRAAAPGATHIRTPAGARCRPDAGRDAGSTCCRRGRSELKLTRGKRPSSRDANRTDALRSSPIYRRLVGRRERALRKSRYGYVYTHTLSDARLAMFVRRSLVAYGQARYVNAARDSTRPSGGETYDADVFISQWSVTIARCSPRAGRPPRPSAPSSARRRRRGDGGQRQISGSGLSGRRWRLRLPVRILSVQNLTLRKYETVRRVSSGGNSERSSRITRRCGGPGFLETTDDRKVSSGASLGRLAFSLSTDYSTRPAR
ncbi:hypothetical protein EVAR_17681_1 [Eumeta japonica]|uniref:Uncharacterized protein n=1 Tax=Eumeta variegata TaxID=151549 RepID=A0A4C1URN3_EUMVA|nr:hypothetical protein EVAR_17681_1 [Eumeta japonica]